MQGWLLWLALGGSLSAAATVGEFGKGQVFISVYATFAPAAGGGNTDYDLSFHSAVNRNICLGFSYIQRQSQYRGNEGSLRIPLAGMAPAAAQAYEANLYASNRIYSLEGEYHFTGLRIARLDAFGGAGIGLEIYRCNSVFYEYRADGAANASLEISGRRIRKYYPAAHFFAGLRYYLAETLALAARAGYQYSGLTDAAGYFGFGLTFRIR